MISEASEELPFGIGSLKKVSRFLPKVMHNKIREVREGVTFPDVCEVGLSDLKAKFLVGSFSERSRIQRLGRESEVISKLLETLGGDNILLDIGSHVGTYTVMAGLKGSRVIAIEPEESIFERLQKNIELNSISERVVALNCAVGAENGIQTIYSDGIDSISPSIGVDVHNHLGSKGNVEVRTVDSVIDELSAVGKIDHIPETVKIDVEGMEAGVLKGMLKTLQSEDNPKHLFIEIHSGLLPRYGSSRDEVLGMLNELGYAQIDSDKVKFKERDIIHFSKV